jgi:CheY-like chemotaxis protein
MKTILLAEDSEDEVFFFIRALRKVDPARAVRVVINGLQVIDYLSGSGIYQSRKFFPLPSVVILDLKLPCLNGLEALHWIRSQEQFKRLPVVMLTSSNEPKDINRAYALGVNSYFLKPGDQIQFTDMLRSIHHYWFQFCQFPTIHDGHPGPVETGELDGLPASSGGDQMCGDG